MYFPIYLRIVVYNTLMLYFLVPCSFLSFERIRLSIVLCLFFFYYTWYVFYLVDFFSSPWYVFPLVTLSLLCYSFGCLGCILNFVFILFPLLKAIIKAISFPLNTLSLLHKFLKSSLLFLWILCMFLVSYIIFWISQDCLMCFFKYIFFVKLSFFS